MTAFELGAALNALTPRRLHRHSWLFITINLVIGNVIPLALGLWQQFRDPTATSIILILAALLIVLPLVHALSYRLHISGEDIVIYSGRLFKSVRHVPLANLHNVNLRRNVLHRWLAVAEVRLETAGSGGESEAVLRVLSLEDAQHLQRYLLSQQQSQSSPHHSALAQTEAQIPHTGDNLLPLPHGELIRLGLSTNQGLGISAFIFYVFIEFQDYDRMVAWIGGRLFDSLWLTEILSRWWIMALLALFVLWILNKLSAILFVYLGYSHFTLLDSGGERIQQQRGLLTQHSSHIRKTRIQVWRIQQNPSLRLFKRYRISIDTAVMDGGKGGERGISLLVPIAEQETIQSLLRHWQLPYFTQVQRLAARAWRRIFITYVFKSSLYCGILALGLVGFSEKIPVQSAAWLWLALIPLQLIAAVRRAAFAGWHCEKGYFFYRDGWLWRHWHIIALKNIHAIALQHNYFDRRYRMASLILDSMGCSALNRPFAIRYLPQETAKILAKLLWQRQIKQSAKR